MDETAASRAAQEAAHDDLQFIRRTLAASGHLSIVPGKGMVAIGLLALAAVWLNQALIPGIPFERFPSAQLASPDRDAFWALAVFSVAIWPCLFLVCLAIGAFTMRAKAIRTGQAFWSPVLRKAMWGYAAAMALGALLTFSALDNPQRLPEIWLGCYGVALIGAGAVSISPIRWMGVCFLVLAGLAAFTPPHMSTLLLGLGFGWLHISFGAYIAWRHDG